MTTNDIKAVIDDPVNWIIRTDDEGNLCLNFEAMKRASLKRISLDDRSTRAPITGKSIFLLICC